ncbi:hypothetical protein KIPB_012002, partial [Kipferlia bialata]|eukprot:g12002.t1
MSRRPQLSSADHMNDGDHGSQLSMAEQDQATAAEFSEIPADRYRVAQHIGKGAFSKVLLAYTPMGHRRAVKRIRLTAKPHQLLKEIEFLRRLEGKESVVQIKEFRLLSYA